MLKVLIVAATGSLIFEYIGADPDHYSTGKCHWLLRALCLFWVTLAWPCLSEHEPHLESLRWARFRPVAEIYLIIMSSL